MNQKSYLLNYKPFVSMALMADTKGSFVVPLRFPASFVIADPLPVRSAGGMFRLSLSLARPAGTTSGVVLDALSRSLISFALTLLH
jgi:hypothetical protein